MLISARTPATIDGTFGLWAIARLNMSGDGLARYGESSPAPVAVEAILYRYRVRDDGVAERSPLAPVADSGHSTRVACDDLLALAAQRPDVAAAVASLTAALAAYAAERGLL